MKTLQTLVMPFLAILSSSLLLHSGWQRNWHRVLVREVRRVEGGRVKRLLLTDATPGPQLDRQIRAHLQLYAQLRSLQRHVIQDAKQGDFRATFRQLHQLRQWQRHHEVNFPCEMKRQTVRVVNRLTNRVRRYQVAAPPISLEEQRLIERAARNVSGDLEILRQMVEQRLEMVSPRYRQWQNQKLNS